MAKRFIILIILIIAVALGFYFYSGIKPAGNSTAMNNIPNVTVFQVKRIPYQQKLEALGHALASESVTISANTTDHVIKIYFNDGTVVKKGDVLVELDNAEEKAQLEDAQAKLTEAQKQFQRIVELAKKGAASKQQLDAQQALFESAQAQYNTIQARLEDRIIKAPFDGITGFRKISVGALVEPGTEITTLDDLTPIKVDFTLPERYLATVKPNMEIIASTVAYPEKTFSGRINLINSRVDPVTRSITVRGLIDNHDLLIKPGMLLTIDLIVQSTSVIKIPETAVISIKDKKFVYVVDAQKHVKQQEITTGLRDGDYIIVNSGLQENDNVVVLGSFKLTPGQQVNIVGNAKD